MGEVAAAKDALADANKMEDDLAYLYAAGGLGAPIGGYILGRTGTKVKKEVCSECKGACKVYDDPTGMDELWGQSFLGKCKVCPTCFGDGWKMIDCSKCKNQAPAKDSCTKCHGVGRYPEHNQPKDPSRRRLR